MRDLLKRKPYAKRAADEGVERPVDETSLATETIIIFSKKQ